jgi:hypothetical protein
MDMKCNFVKNGFFIRDISNYIFFYRYNEITCISPIRKDGGYFKIYISFLTKDRDQLVLKDKKEEIFKEIHNKILNGWINYHSQESNIEKKLDALLNHIEIMPGGEEYEKAKNNSESIISFNAPIS